MSLPEIADETRSRLAVSVGVLLMISATLAAGALQTVGRETGAQAALGIAFAASIPVLVGTVAISPVMGHRSLRIVLAVGAIVALLPLTLSRG